MNVLEELNKGNIPEDIDIYNSFCVTNAKLFTYDKIICSISGGSDSDVMLHLLETVNKDIGTNIEYIYFDTGLEYDATKEHIKELEEKYKIKITVVKAKVPIPISCKKYGQPFLSKQVSEYISRLQKYNFQWENEDFETLLNRYCIKADYELEKYLEHELNKAQTIKGYTPKLKKYSKTEYGWYTGCVISLKWWCNERGINSRFNIEYNKYLKEFMTLHPPWFNISPKCCKGAKKDVIHDYLKEHSFDLSCVGVRKAEGGTRATAYKNCFTAYTDKEDEYRPIFWYKKDTKELFVEFFNITHSRCYTEYGLE